MRRRHHAIVLLGVALPALLSAAVAAPRATLTRVIVRASSPAEAAAAVARAGGRVTGALPIVEGVAARVPAARLSLLHAEPGIVVTPDARIRLADTLDDQPAGPASVFTAATRADALRAEGIDGSGVRVALIDTGISPVPDLADRIVPVPDPAGTGTLVDCVNLSGETTCTDSYGHGTFVAGLIAGTGAASAGTYTGVAPGAELVSVKIAGRDGSADVSTVLAAIQWVVSFAGDLEIRVLNLSLGTDSTVSYERDPLNFAVQRAWDAGIVVVVSASNRGPDAGTISKPGDDPYVVTVGAVDDRETAPIDDDALPAFSGRGPTAADGLAKPDLVAPGARVVSLRSPGSYVEEAAPGGIDETYRRGSGTSMSTAIVSGIAALALQANPTWTPDRTKFALTATARPVADPDPLAVGAGIADAYAATRAAPDGLANQTLATRSDASDSLDGTREQARTARCRSSTDCDTVDGGETAAVGVAWDRDRYMQPWTGSSWYASPWSGSSWYGSSWYGSSWYGSSWYGSSWYGTWDDSSYGVSVAGSSWYGAWE